MNLRITLLVLAAIGSVAVAQTTRLVPSQYTTIQSAINASINGDTVLVAPGTYPGSVNFSGKTITVTSSSGPAVTTIANAPGTIGVTFQGGEGPTTLLSGFRISGGGGGIACTNASPQISNCIITNQVVANGTGGGIRCTTTGAGSCSPVISACTISNNIAGAGGGVFFDSSSTATSLPAFVGCKIVGNTTYTSTGVTNPGDGGGMYLGGAHTSAALTKCVFDGNNSEGGLGGGLRAAGVGSLSLTQCIVTNNLAIGGGYAGLALNVGGGSLAGCLISGNYGGGATVVLSNTLSGATANVSVNCCTISHNQISNGSSVGGLAVYNGPVTATVTNSILWGNTGMDLFHYPPNGALITASFSDVESGIFNAGAAILSIDPLFIDGAHDDFHLSSVSPVRNAGNPGAVGLPLNDIDDTPRVIGGIVDLGFDEVPTLTHPGTPDGLDLYAVINGVGDPLASTRAAVAGDLLSAKMKSSTGSLVGGLPLFAARLYFTGNPFAVPGGAIWLDSQSVFVYGALSAPPFGFPGLPADGLQFDFTVPAGLAGQTVRMQGLVTSVNAANGSYATSNATEVTF